MTRIASSFGVNIGLVRSLNPFMQIVHEPGNKIRYVPTCPGIVAGARRSAKRTTAKRVIALGCAETTSWGGGGYQDENE